MILSALAGRKRISLIVLVASVSLDVTALEMINVAHRGLWKEANVPQNTVEAIKAAYEADATIVETDFVETKSGEIICLHDRQALESMTSLAKDPWTITKADREQIDLGEKMHLPRPYRIPLLKDVLAVVPKRCVLQAEIKVYGPTYARQFDEAVKSAVLSETNIIVSSFQSRALADFHRQFPKYRTLWLGCGIDRRGFDLDAVLSEAKGAGFDIICPGNDAARRAGFTVAHTKRIRNAGFGFRVFGVNSLAALRYAVSVEAEAFTCNYYLAAYGWARELPEVRLLPGLRQGEWQ